MVFELRNTLALIRLETLEAGSDFAKQIAAALADTKLVLVLIDKDWLGQGGGRFVRLEVALALRGKSEQVSRYCWYF